MKLGDCKPGDWVTIGGRYARYCTTIKGHPYIRWGGEMSDKHEDYEHGQSDLVPMPADTECEKILSGIKGW